MNRIYRYIKQEKFKEGLSVGSNSANYQSQLVSAKTKQSADDFMISADHSIQTMKKISSFPERDAKKSLEQARYRANDEMQSHYFFTKLADSKIRVEHLHNSESVITKQAPEAAIGNAYMNIREQMIDGKTHYSVIAGASQAPNKMHTVTDDSQIKDFKAKLRDESSMHIAQAIYAHILEFELNNRNRISIENEKIFSHSSKKTDAQEYQAPNLVVINNYMTDAFFADAKSVLPRKNALKLINQDLNQDNKAAHDFRDLVAKHLSKMVESAGLQTEYQPEKINKITKEAVAAGKILFQQQGVNAVRILGDSSDSRLFTKNDTTILSMAKQVLETLPENRRAAEIKNLTAEYEKTRMNIMLSKLALPATALVNTAKIAPVLFRSILLSRNIKKEMGSFLTTCSGPNDELHKEAIKLLLVSKIGGTSVSGCKSAKDRMGMILAAARAQEMYMNSHHGEVASQSNKEYQQLFAKEWLSGQLQYVCHVNAPGAAAVKNPLHVLPPAFRDAIFSEVQQQSALIAQDKSLTEQEKNSKMQKLVMFLPEVSHAISNLNKYPEKGEKVADHIRHQSQKYFNKLLSQLPVIFPPSRVEHVTVNPILSEAAPVKMIAIHQPPDIKSLKSDLSKVHVQKEDEDRVRVQK